VLVGSGPNGLAAAITLANTGHSVLVCEARESVGGGMRSAELTLPGFVHDVCSAIHPLAIASPFFRQLPLDQFGLEWIYPTFPLVHPLDDGSAVILFRSVDETAHNLDKVDTHNYQKIISPFVHHSYLLFPEILSPLKWPDHTLFLAGFGRYAVQSATGLLRRKFSGSRARALFAGLAAHSMLPLERKITAGVGLVLGIAGHAFGWPFPRGGAKRIAEALEAQTKLLGVEFRLNQKTTHISHLPSAKAVLFDLTPYQILEIAGSELPVSYRRRIKKYRYGQGVFKLDLALAGPIPFRSAECRQAGTVHIGGSWQEIANVESEVWQGKHPEKPFVLLAQQSLFDASRSPEGKHTAWAYCHVPAGSNRDMSEKIENQVERFAPGFRDLILARYKMTALDFEKYNPNYVGGDINGGVQDWRQLFTRPVWRFDPYSAPNRRLFICSSSTPPGGGIHGMCGYHAAKSALKKVFD
jgi:phytoene dehydrogenase-like protein